MTKPPIKPLETRDGPMLALPGDDYIGRSLEVYGEYSELEASLLRQLIKPGDVVVEAGSNIGAHTIALARRCAPGVLFAFEPQQRAFQLLCANLALNGVTNVVATPDACGEKQGWAKIPAIDYEQPQNFGSVTVVPLDAAIAGHTVRVTPIDAYGLTKCDLIKADVEGFEALVLQGARETIARCRPYIYVENNLSEEQANIISLIDDLGYNQYWHTPPLFNPDNYRGISHDIFNGVASLNIVAFPKEITVGLPAKPPIDPANWVSPARAAERPWYARDVPVG